MHIVACILILLAAFTITVVALRIDTQHASSLGSALLDRVVQTA
jgi:hypothetical protein